jgi:hypothetical protein
MKFLSKLAGRPLPPRPVAACDFRRVAGGEIVGNPEAFLHRIEVAGFQNLGAKAGFPQVLRPTQAAAAIRVPVNRYDLFLRGEARSWLKQRGSPHDKDGSARQSRIDICHGGPQRSVTMNSAGRSIHSNMSVHEAV